MTRSNDEMLAIVDWLRAAGVDIGVNGDRLTLDGPEEALT